MKNKKPIRMRTCKREANCELCENNTHNSLEMFQFQIGDTIHTVCDQCLEQIFQKSLSGVCHVNAKTKDNRDMAIIRKRNVASREVGMTINEALKDVDVEEDSIQFNIIGCLKLLSQIKNMIAFLDSFYNYRVQHQKQIEKVLNTGMCLMILMLIQVLICMID